ncbi:MAG TPA: OmpH family outer membrane protein [Puia sp.]|nr:OmpH family outer membrane protein [Puia sp.]
MRNKSAFFFALLFLLSLGWGIYMHFSAPKTAFIIIQDVYNGYDMKKEMEKKFNQTKDARQKILDSLAFELNILGKKVQDEHEKNPANLEQFKSRREEYLQRKQNSEEDNNQLSKQYDQEILTQLNQYVKDYGKENGYTYIFGNDGNGSLMYAKEGKDISKQVIEYINEKYKGVK